MPDITEPPETDGPQGPLWRRLAWFAGLALASALTTAAMAYGLKALLH